MDGHDATAIRCDRWGYPVRTSSDACVAAVNAYSEQVLAYGRNRSVIVSAAVADTHCVLAGTLAAHFLASRDPARASALLRAAADNLDNATPYERAVFRAVSCLLNEDEKDDELAIDRHFELLKEFPKDLLSLKRAQVICFYMGRADLSLALVDQVLAHNGDQSYINGMLAFSLLELGRMEEAENAAKKGIDINKSDFWSQHNLCHVYQYKCCFKEAVDFMEACSSSWSLCSSFLYTHNWWHVAVCYLEGDSSLTKVLELYDHHIWKELQKNDAEPGEVYVNALGLLLHVYVRGQMSIFEERLLQLANLLMDKHTWHMEWFLDILTLWALACTRKNKAEDLLESMKLRYNSLRRKKQLQMQSGILLAEAIYEYGKGNYQKVYHLLSPDFDAMAFKMIGASDEQLDVFNEVWYTVLLNVGQISKAIEDINKGLSKRKGTPFLWRLLERAYSMEGSSDAILAAEKAKALEAAYFK